jgi:HJR/Mrr/RecB family endonuclease
VDRRNREFEEKVQDATSELVKAKKKLTGFLERNTWFIDALDEVVAAADEEAEKFIAKQEVVLAKRRAENMFIDSSESENQNALNEQGTFSKVAPRKMERFSPRDYEIFCAGWVEYLGGKNVRVTQQSADGGIDIISDNEVAQVKLHGSPVAVQPIRELFGVSQSLSKTPLFFTSTGYTQAAITFAEANDIFLFIADPVKEDLRGVTEMSKALKRTGLSLNRDSDEAFDEISEGNAHSGVEGYEDGTATDGYFNR